jgi:hypothetical protein
VQESPHSPHTNPSEILDADGRGGYFLRMGKKGNSSKDDPLHLQSTDREIHIEKLKRQITEIAGGQVIFGESPGCTPSLEAAFLEHVLQFESQAPVRPFDALISEGVSLPPDRELDDAALSAKLWELIRALADRHLFLERTDHLSDRELYAWLRDDALREEYEGFGSGPGDWHLDVLGGCSEEDLIIAMRFYATREERKSWAAEFPDFPMPRREKRPHDRDRLLPQPDPPC